MNRNELKKDKETTKRASALRKTMRSLVRTYGADLFSYVANRLVQEFREQRKYMAELTKARENLEDLQRRKNKRMKVRL
jgi:predicted mannosyl-3-phosphoglycerate phosphatase (HAD superfamily)